MVVDKKKILESWIMVEHLSEGNIDQRKKEFLRLDQVQEEDFYTFFSNRIKENNLDKKQKAGIVVYFDIFDFALVVNILRKKFGLRESNEDIEYGSKFSFALYFDKALNFDSDKTFFTESGYINYYKKIPDEDAFKEYEDDFKEELVEYFDSTADDQEKFNSALKKVFRKFGIKYENCRFQILNNMETDATNLHSFFIDDLNMAKTVNTDNFMAYLYGGDISKRVNLDSKKDSENFNPVCLKKILQPKNYPLGRFPSNTEYALSFMQQVAVNLAIGYDNKAIRSVNGPPGTGKTTLLKDIFAELVVRQAFDMSNMKTHELKGSVRTKYFKEAKIGELPKHITKNSIVVASSNNGAVQNIVNELPLIKDIDEELQDELKKADYFGEISNNIFRDEWIKDENGNSTKELIKETNSENNDFWGLFSLEGGRSENITKILNYMKAVVKYLNEEYEPNNQIYDEFKKQYHQLEKIRNKAKELADINKRYNSIYTKVSNFDELYRSEYIVREQRKKQESKDYELEEFNFNEQIKKLQFEFENIQRENENQEMAINTSNELLRKKEDHKPSIFDFSGKKRFNSEMADLINRISNMQNELNESRKKESSLRAEIYNLSSEINNKKMTLNRNNALFDRWIEHKNNEKIRLTSELDGLIYQKNKFKDVLLDMTKDYEKLQMFNPWFDREFRKLQSKLFINALKVRKQFLYENRKNINAAIIIWDKQKDYMDNKYIIETAWHWINLVIPVISSTFASFSRMCKNLGPETMGHLFIDEAGQALPQAAVGAIFRSRHVMLVGDPAQIKPVLTLESNVLNMLSEHFGVSQKYLSDSASAQTLADAASQYGFYKEIDQSEDSWIGIPLWVHRRCQYPMFNISNEISYNGLMVQGKKEKGKVGWYDIKGKAQDKFVNEQCEFLKAEIEKQMKDDPETSIYVISPFRNIAKRLARELHKIKFTKYENGKPINVGTIHTFQGKEANIVYLVLGADHQSKGAAAWAVKEANMMNVAATRAKKEFYIIGDKKLYGNIQSDVITTTINVINRYKNENPELVYEVNNQELEEKREAKDYSQQNQESEKVENHNQVQDSKEEENHNQAQESEKIRDNNPKVENKNSKETNSLKSANESNICPLCGGNLIIKKGPYGEFWGCRNFPKCKGKKSIKK